VFATQQNSSSPTKTGTSSAVSGWCGAPTHGSLERKTSPGRTPSETARRSRTYLIDSEWLLEKYWRFGPRKTRSPTSVSSDVWKSRVSIVIGETHRRCSSAECSKFAASSA